MTPSTDAGQLAKARAAWARSVPFQGTPVEPYLRGRAITCPLPATLRGLPPRHGREPGAMIAPFGLATEPEPGVLAISLDAVQGVHMTFVEADGRPAHIRIGDQLQRKITLGRNHDVPIMLAPPGDGLGLVIAEGIEDALSVHQATGLGAWAAGSAGRLPKIARHVPDYIDRVTLIEDDNDRGRRGCAGLAAALHARGIEVLIHGA